MADRLLDDAGPRQDSAGKVVEDLDAWNRQRHQQVAAPQFPKMQTLSVQVLPKKVKSVDEAAGSSSSSSAACRIGHLPESVPSEGSEAHLPE